MAKLKIAVLGVGNIGKFHVREFVNAGVDVTAILGSSRETVTQTAESLRSEFGVHAKPYFELARLIETEEIDAVSVCTPPDLHYIQVKECLEAGRHVLCEKPFVLSSCLNNYNKANELVELSEKQGKILSVNTQWPSVLDYIKNQVDFSKLRSFSMNMQPESFGIDMLTEQLAHTNSMVVKLMPDGYAVDIKFVKRSPEVIDLHFTYTNENLECAIHYNFTHKIDRPRRVAFSFNGIEFRREIGENYQQRLVTDKTRFDIGDPLKISIGKFVGAIEGKNPPPVSRKEIVENMALQDRIIAEYTKTY